mgnify:CR=1 FL=1
MTTGHAEGAPGPCRRTPENRDTDAGALARKAPGDPNRFKVTMVIAAHNEEKVIAAVANALPQCQVLVLSDYQKGVVTPRVMKTELRPAIGLFLPDAFIPNDAAGGSAVGEAVETTGHADQRSVRRRPSDTRSCG